MRWYEIVLLFLIVPIGVYLREQTYKSTRGNTTIGRDLENLYFKLQDTITKVRKRIYKK